MAVGDIVKYRGRYLKVLSENSGLRTLTLQGWDARTVEVADDDPEIQDRSSPGDWPFLTAPTVSWRAKRPVRLTRFIQGKTVELEPFREWSPTDILRVGGPIFIHPGVRLLPGEVLVLHYEGGQSSRLAINKNFGSIKQRQARANKRPRITRPRSIYDHIEEEDW
jgi:hypothetical protein